MSECFFVKLAGTVNVSTPNIFTPKSGKFKDKVPYFQNCCSGMLVDQRS